MNTYRIRDKKGERGLRLVKADSVNGFQPTCDTYIFKLEEEIVAIVPKAVVLSVARVRTSEPEDES